MMIMLLITTTTMMMMKIRLDEMPLAPASPQTIGKKKKKKTIGIAHRILKFKGLIGDAS